jgi:flagellar protein FlgJ
MEMINLNANISPLIGDAKRASSLAGIAGTAGDAKKIKVAKEFEAIFVRQLLSQMKNTIGDSGFLQDGGSKQIQDMFWSFLGDEIADQGGLGMWENIYKTMDTGEEKTGGSEKLNAEV